MTYPNRYRGITDNRFSELLLSECAVLFRSLIYERDLGVCAICGQHVEFRIMHLDHKYPRVLGGSDDAHNIQVTHPVCNLRKNGTPPDKVTYDAFCDPSVSPEDIITITEAATLLDAATCTIYQAIKRGKIRILTHIDGRKMVSRTDVAAYQPDREKQQRSRNWGIISRAESHERVERYRREAAERANRAVARNATKVAKLTKPAKPIGRSIKDVRSMVECMSIMGDDRMAAIGAAMLDFARGAIDENAVYKAVGKALDGKVGKRVA